MYGVKGWQCKLTLPQLPCRFTGLTKLSLNVGWLKAPLIKPVGVAALKQLNLYSIAISEPWLQYIYQLPCLETLYLFHCREDGPIHHTALTLASPTRYALDLH